MALETSMGIRDKWLKIRTVLDKSGRLVTIATSTVYYYCTHLCIQLYSIHLPSLTTQCLFQTSAAENKNQSIKMF